MLDTQTLEQLKVGLFARHYNLLLGSGASSDSFDRAGEALDSATVLRNRLNVLKKVPASTSLARVSALLSPDEVQEYLTEPYASCKPGRTVKLLPRFLWKGIYSFNIDDCVEAAYAEDDSRYQSIDTINFNHQFRTANHPSTLAVVHLHGFTGEAESGYVFSKNQYAQMSREGNPWMHILAELLASEPFIVAGTSLDESDLEYYLSRRNPISAAADRAPSILVEPCPNPITEDLCRQHDLVLVKATLADFLDWLNAQLGKPPNLFELLIPAREEVFHPKPPAIDVLAFYTAFELVRPIAGSEADGKLTPFFYGKAPTWRDLAANVDVPTDDDQRLGAAIRNYLAAPQVQTPIYFLSGAPGSGKTTCVRRVAYDLAKSGVLVFRLLGGVVLNLEQLVRCLRSVKRPFVLLVDSAADHVTTMSAFARADHVSNPFVILAADRRYREEHVDRTIGDVDLTYFDIQKWTTKQSLQLIERYRTRGYIGAKGAIKNVDGFAANLKHDVVAVAACRILNDFKPLEVIVRSVWNDADPTARKAYLAAAVAQYCTSVGISYPVLQAACPHSNLRAQFVPDCVLPLTYSPEADDHVVPLSPIIAERVLAIAQRERRDVLLDIFVRMARALAPYVNRRTAIQGTPEAKLAGRLFNATGVVGPMLGAEMAPEFYEKVKDLFEWNSRYWEQRALLTQPVDIDLAIRYARQAVAIDGHPFPWTTLASTLVHKLEKAPQERDALFDEAYDLLYKTLRREEASDWRPTVHAYVTLFNGAYWFIKSGGFLSANRVGFIKQQIEKAEVQFRRDAHIPGQIKRLTQLL